MKSPKNLHNLLSEWGAGQRRRPTSNETLKNQALARLSEKPERLPKRASGLPWLSFFLTGAAVIVLVLPHLGGQLSRTGTQTVTSKESAGSSVSPSMPPIYSSDSLDSGLREIAPDIYYPSPPQAGVPSTDTRELLKKNYGANVKTREVIDVASRIETMVRGYGGRIDNSSSSEKSGYLGFVIPADKFDAFRNELKSLVGDRYFTENLQTQNLLPQKRSLEKQQSDIQERLNQIKGEKEKLIAAHSSAVASLQGQINSASRELAQLQNQPTSPENEARKRVLQSRINSLRAQLNQENSNYTGKLGSLDSQIQNSEAILKNLNEQNGQLLDNVATVNGNISINWISFWEMVDLYLPSYWFPLLLAIAALGAYWWHRRNNRLIIP